MHGMRLLVHARSGSTPEELAVRLAQVLEQDLVASFYTLAADTEQADRSIVVAPCPSTPWVCVIDDGQGVLQHGDDAAARLIWEHSHTCCVEVSMGPVLPPSMVLYVEGELASVLTSGNGLSPTQPAPGPLQKDLTPWLAVCPPGTSLEQLRAVWDGAGPAPRQVRALADLLQVTPAVEGVFDPMASGVQRHQVRLRLKACAPRPIQSTLPKGTFASLRDNPMQIPRFLCASQSAARRQAKRVCAAAVKAGSWRGVLETLEYVPIDEAPGEIVMSHAFHHAWKESVWPSVLPECLLEAAHKGATDREQYISRHTLLLAEGADHFWLCLCFITSPGLEWRGDPAVELTVLGKVLPWWPEFCRLTRRMGPHEWMEVGWAVPLCYWALRNGLLSQSEYEPMLRSQDPFSVGTLIASRLAGATEWRKAVFPS